MTRAGDRNYGLWFGTVAALIVLCLLASPATAQPAVQAELTGDQPIYFQSGSGPSGDFSASRTGLNEVTVNISASLVNASQTVNITTGNESDWHRSWNLSRSTPTNNAYETTIEPPNAGEVSNRSLVNATVTLVERNVTDTAHLHSAQLSSVPVWTNNSNVYVPLNETVGITEGDPVTLTIGSDTFGTGLDTERNLFVVPAENVPVENRTVTPTVALETDGMAISDETTVMPEIRYLHNGMVLWHPYIRNSTSYEITVHRIDGDAIDTTESRTATRDGVVSVPNSTALSEAATANISFNGGEANVGPIRINGISQTATATARVGDARTVRLSHAVEPLSVSSVLVDGTGVNNTEAVYLSRADFETTNRTIGPLSRANVTENSTLRLTTDAGIVELRLLQQAGTQETGQGGIDIMQLALLLVGGLALGGISGVSGAVAGAKLDIQDLVQELLLLVMLILVLALLFVLGYSFVESFKSNWEIIAGGAVLLLAAVTGGYTLGKLKYGRSVGTGATSAQKVTVSVTDGRTKIPGTSKITARRERDGETVTTTISDGLGRIGLKSGTWSVQATHGGHTSEAKPVEDLDNITLEIDLPDVQVRLQDSSQETPIPDASVRMDAAGETDAKRTGTSGSETGVVAFEPPADADAVTITASHDRYHETVEEYQLTSDGVQDTIELEQQSGTAKLLSQIDGIPAGDMPIILQPNDQYLEHLYGASTTVTTGADGTANADVLIGQYRAEIDLSNHPTDLFEMDTETFTITEARETEVTLDATFTWDLSQSQRDRIREIRDDIAGLTAKSGIDTAIPNYYASVVETVLDAVEAFPENGHHFAEIEAHPDEIVTATLDGAEEMADMISDAMSTKRNRDLFSACSDMDAVDVRWDGTFDFNTLVGRLNEDSTDLRRTFAQRADSVSDRIDAERGDLSEIAPARDMLDNVNIPDAGEQADRIVRTHIALLALDSVDELFDHPELTERLSRTVF